MIVSVKELLEKAQKGSYAVGAFNVMNLETIQAVLNTASNLSSPVILQMTEKSLDYAGGRALFQLAKNIAEFYHADIPVGLHLDHGKSLEIVEHAVEIGFPSVMYDGSRKRRSDNIAITKKVVEFCHARGVFMQGELGNVPYVGEMTAQSINWDNYMTDPQEAKEFVEETGIDTLAVAIGNAHGFFPERPEPDYERLEKIRALVSVPIVLHGASDWMEQRVKEVIKRGVSCFNVDTALRLAYLGRLSQLFHSGDETDIRKVLGEARLSASAIVAEKMRFFESEGKAEGWNADVI